MQWGLFILAYIGSNKKQACLIQSLMEFTLYMLVDRVSMRISIQAQIQTPIMRLLSVQ